jgi:hypothetical protein
MSCVDSFTSIRQSTSSTWPWESVGVTWSQAALEFVPDGSLRDIYVKRVSLDDWETVYRWLLVTYPHVFTRDGGQIDPPPSVEYIWQDRAVASNLLTLQVGELRVNCHFFHSDDLELDIRPEEVQNEEGFAALSDLLIGLGRQVEKQVILTYENGKEDAVFLEYRPEDSALVYHKPHWR